MFTLTGLFVLVVAVIGSAGMVAAMAWIWYRIRRLEDGRLGMGDERLLEEVERLRDELESARSETRALAEQVDFMERLLGSGQRDRASPDDRARPTEDDGGV